jgi:glycine/D-amino acid oxidase-like deaminating enzyme
MEFLKIATENGARLLFDTKMIKWDTEVDGSISVVTNGGTFRLAMFKLTNILCKYLNCVFLNNRTKKLVLSVGAWAPDLYGHSIPDSLRVERRTLFWFDAVSNDSKKSLQVIVTIDIIYSMS